MRVIEDIKAEFLHCVTDGVIGTKPLKELIAPTDPVTIVISDMTRFWMRQDVICELLLKYLHDEMGVGYDQIAVVVALGTHRKNTAETAETSVSEFVHDHVASVTDQRPRCAGSGIHRHDVSRSFFATVYTCYPFRSLPAFAPV